MSKRRYAVDDFDIEDPVPGSDRVVVRWRGARKGVNYVKTFDAYDLMALANRLQAAAVRAFNGNAVTFSPEELARAARPHDADQTH